MKNFLFAAVLAFICICGLNYVLGCMGLSIHNHLLNTAISALAGSGSVLLAARIQL
jgi:hypothetical protein